MPTRSDEATAIRAAEGDAVKSEYVRRIFSEIAPRYDLLNHLLSLNIDRRWRRKAIAALHIERRPAGRYLDLCAGTLDVSTELAAAKGFRGTVFGIDFAEPMLRAGRAKIGMHPGIVPIGADALQLPLPLGSIDGAIVAFGIRNVAGLDESLREVRRVLAPDARFVILEFSTPRSSALNAVWQVYFQRVMPAIAGRISGHPSAYRYLPRSVANFPVEEELALRLEGAGFGDVTWQSLTLGVAAIHVGVAR